VRSHTPAFYLLGLAPERFPNVGSPEDWEIPSDRQAARPWTLDELAARLRQPARMHVLARASDLPGLEAAVGRPLRRLRDHGRGAYAVVLVAND
jgi:hypothetical protein